jgi:hypothetical protein
MVDSMRSQKSDSPDFGRSLMVPFAHANFARDMRLMRQKTIITHRCLWNGVFPGIYNKKSSSCHPFVSVGSLESFGRSGQGDGNKKGTYGKAPRL